MNNIFKDESKLQITVHRGTKEIGGTVIQVATETTRLLLDSGLPLSESASEINITDYTPDAVLISHPHQDHYGLIEDLPDNIPVYIGKTGKELINGVRKFIKETPLTNNFHYIEKWQPFVIGDITITPLLVDHSAVDAYAFMLEAKGKKIFYTGDFRATGNKPFLFEKLISDLPADIDMMLLEGTLMRRSNDPFPSEKVVAEKIEELLAAQQNISFLLSSSQNIDRLVSAYHACVNTGKKFVVDIYTAWILEKVKAISSRTPTMDSAEVCVYADYNFNEVLKSDPNYFGDFQKRLYQNRVTKEELAAHPEQYLMLTKMSKGRIMDLYKKYGKINVIYSQWLGYLEYSNEDYFGAEEISAYQHDEGVNFIYAHTSGHATKETLRKLVDSVKPKRIIPIHTEHPQDFKTFCPTVVLPGDGETLYV